MRNKLLRCPRCEYPQYCPCKSCESRLPKGLKPWIDHRTDEPMYDVECAGCGLTKSAEWWSELECRLYASWRESNVSTDENIEQSSILFVYLSEQFKDKGEAFKWLFAPQPDWLNISPIQMIQRGKIDAVIRLLDPKGDLFNG